MRQWQIVVIALFSVILIGCSSTISSLNGVDKNIPIVSNIKTIVDVGSVGFEWDIINDVNVKGFVIYRDEDNKNEYEEIAHIKNPLASHFVDKGLMPEKQYSYFFYTIGVDSHSPRSDVVSIKTSFINPVENLYASNDYPKKVKLLWNPHQNPSISHYLIQRQEHNGFKTIATVNNRLLVEYFDENLDDESNYNYRIIAVDYMGNQSRPSKTVTARTKNRPSVSTNISATNNLPTSIVISWDTVNNVAAYRIYRSKDSQGSYNAIGTTSSNQFTDQSLQPGASYYYKVSSIDDTEIESVLSDPIKGSTKELPKSPKIIKGYVDKQESNIEWEASKDAQYFVVHRKESGLFGDIMRFKVKGTSFIDKDVKVGKEYIYYVVSVDDTGLESAPSEEIVLSIK